MVVQGTKYGVMSVEYGMHNAGFTLKNKLCKTSLQLTSTIKPHLFIFHIVQVRKGL